MSQINTNTILIKRRTTGEAGAPGALSGGELAFNEVNSVLYYGSENGVIPIGGTGEFATNTLVGSISADLSSQIGTLDLRVTDEVATLNTTIQSVSSTLDAKIDAQIAAVIDFAPDALNTLNELASALGDDENFASNLVSTLGNVNSTIASVSSTLNSKIDNEVSTLNSTVQSVSASLESAIGSLNSDTTSKIASLSAELKGDISTEETNRINADSALTSTVQSVSADLSIALGVEVARATAAEGALDLKIDAEVTTLEETIASEVSTLNTTVQSVSSALASDLASVNTRVDNVLSNVDAVALNSLAEIVSAFQSADSDLNGAITSLAGSASTQLASVSAALDYKIDSEVATLEASIADEVARATDAEAQIASDLADEVSRATTAEGVLDSRITSEVSTLNSTIASLSSSVDSEVAALEASISSLNTYVDTNFLNLTGGNISGDLDVSGTITASGGLEISTGGGSTSLFVGSNVVGINTEAPTEAFEVVGNGKFSGTVEVATPSLSGHAANKGYVDTAIANLVDGSPALLDTLNELASAINDDESFAATIATNIGNVSTALASVSATLDQRITDEVATLNSTISDEVDRADAAAFALDTRVSDIEGNYLDKRVGGDIAGPVGIDNNLSVNGNVIISDGSGGQIDLFNNGSASFSGGITVTGEATVAEPTQSASAATKNYVDTLFAVVDGGTF